MLLCLALWGYGAAYVFRHKPQLIIDRVVAQLPYASSVGNAQWTAPDTLELSNVKIGDFFYAYSITVSASVYDLWRHHITALTVRGPQLYMGALNKAMATNTAEASGVDWTITKLTVMHGTLQIDAGANMPPIPVEFGLRRPIIINYLHLKKPDESKSMTEERMVELENINFASPFDPLAPVLSLPLTRIRFTYTELWRHHIRGIDLVRPNLYLGEDLFWFTDQFRKERATEPSTGPGSPWYVGRFSVQYGQLSINAFGQPKVHFPFYFDTEVNDIRLDQLDKISAKSLIAIRHLTKDYPDYKIKIVNLHGKIEFSVPPSDAKANNVVPTISIDELSWNGIAATKVWSSVTFDPSGIYAKLGGDCEKGVMNGNFEVYYTKGFIWNADFFARKIECQPIAEKLAGKYVNLTGAVNGKISVQGKATEIMKCAGTLEMDRPGQLEIKSIDELQQRIPANTIGLKRDAMKLALNAFKFYPYQTGELKIDYTPGNGKGTLQLQGPYGKRDFGIYWHPFATSKVAKDDDNP